MTLYGFLHRLIEIKQSHGHIEKEKERQTFAASTILAVASASSLAADNSLREFSRSDSPSASILMALTRSEVAWARIRAWRTISPGGLNEGDRKKKEVVDEKFHPWDCYHCNQSVTFNVIVLWSNVYSYIGLYSLSNSSLRMMGWWFSFQYSEGLIAWPLSAEAWWTEMGHQPTWTDWVDASVYVAGWNNPSVCPGFHTVWLVFSFICLFVI